jgi:crotonobetainyl-CoA:carnitine CoA-transferase CaiB-like acyl-CoA transferase
LETAIGFRSWTSAQWLADHEEPTRQGSHHRQNAPYQRMQTKDGYLMVRAAGEAIWARCAKALGYPDGARTRVLRPTGRAWRTVRR